MSKHIDRITSHHLRDTETATGAVQATSAESPARKERAAGQRGVRGYRHMRRFAAILITAACLLGLAATSFADSDPTAASFTSSIKRRTSGGSTTSDNTDGVYQGTDKTTFGSPMVLSTIYIDMSKIKGADNEKNAVGKILSDDPGFKIADTSRGDTNFAVYDPTAAGAHKEVLRADQLNDFSGELFQFTYKDAAVLSDGTRADVRFIYSNAHAAVDVRCYTKKTIAGTTQQEVVPYTYNGLFGFARGHKVMPIIYDGKDYGNALTASELALTGHDNAEVQPMISAGLEIDVRIQVVDKQGNPIEGTFINPITGINQRKTTAKSNRPLYNTVGHEYYSEGVRINSGNVSDVYTMGYSAADPYYCISYKQIEGAYEGATRFWAGNYQTNGGNGGNGNYNSGFITTANSKSGISLTVTSGGNGSSGFNESYFLEGDPIWHRIRSVTGPGGNIQTTTEANAGVAGTEGDYGKLNDKGDILDPGTYVVPDGKTVVYTMTPDKGYVLNELRLNNSITNTPTVVAGVADMAAGATKEVDLEQGRKAKITKNADGSYTCEFPKNNYDHTIMVTWVPDTDSVMVEASKKWYDKNNEFGTRDDILLHVNGMSEYDSGESHYYPADFLPAQKFTHGSVADGNEDWTARWGDGKKNNHDYTGAVNREQVYKTKESLPQVVGGKTQYYFYDYATRQFRAYTYNETSGKFEATDTYYWVNFLPKYDESGKQIIYTVEEEVPDGYELTVKTNNRGSASDTMGDFDYTFNNTLEPIGTVKVKATKALEGRPFNGNDEFIFVLAGKHGTPMPVGTPVKIPSKGEDTPVQVAQTIKPTAGTVLAEVDFGVISYRKSNLTKNKIKYADATDEQKNAVRYWTVKDSQTASENRTYDMLESADKTAFNNLATAVKNEATGNTYEKVFYYNITENPKHPDYVENDTSVLNMTVRVVYNELENKIYVEDEDSAEAKNGVQDITAEKNNHLTNPDVTLHRDFFINKYDNKTTWDPEITKTLNGRPISKDQFKDYFTIQADDTPESIPGQVKDKVAKADTPMPNKAYGGDAISNRQEIEKTTAVPKGTNDVKAIVGFDTITYTNDDLLKEVSYSTSEAIRNQVIRWHKGDKVYGPIPADAEASVTKADGSKGTVKYDEATEAQRKEVEATGWTKDGKTYIDLNTMSDDKRAAALAGSTGFYYMNERVFTYKIWESKDAEPGYTNDSHVDEIKVTVTRDNATGEITATPNKTKNQLEFENKYEAKTDIALTGSKVLSGRDLQAGEFSFTISAVTPNAPLPTNITVQNQADGKIDFGNIRFTQNDLKVNKGDNPGAYDAVRTVDGFYEKTFVYEIKETAPASDGNGITTDKSTKTIAITVREDNEGNFKVVAVNGTTAGDADRKISFTDDSVNFGEFNNDYEASGHDTVDATKTLKGGLLKAGDFHFQLLDAKGNVLGTTANAANGAISFPVAYNLSQVREDATAGLCTYDENTKTWTYTYTMKELETDNRGDEKITYDATGIGDGYEVTVAVKDNGDGTLDIKPSTDSTAVTFINTVSTRDLTLQKIWIDNDADGISKVTRPESVTLTVTADVEDTNILSSAEGTEVTKGWKLSGGKSTKDFTLTEDDEKADALWSKTLEGLPRYKADGTAITYSVDELEENVPVNYEKTSVVTAGSTTTVINTYTITKITGTKVWVDGGLPHAISADLDGKLKVYYSEEGSNDKHEVTKPHIDYDNALSQYTVIGLPKHSSDNGKLRTYWVEETKLDNYKVPEYTNTGDYAGKTDGAYDGGTITNKITGKIDVTGTKTWKNENNKKPTLIPPVISLHRQSKKPGASEETAGQGDWSATPKWNEEQTEYTFEEQDKYDEDGYEYTYWVTEETVDGYLPPQYSSGDRAYNEGNITNVKEPTGELDVPVIKVLTGSTRLSDWAGKFRLGLYTGTNGTGTQIENKVTVPDTGVLAADGQSESASVVFSGLYFRIINDNGTLKAQLRSKDNLTGEDEYVDLTKNDDGTYGIKLYIHEDKITEDNTGLTQPADTEVNIILIDNNDGTLTVKTTDQDSYIVENDHTQEIDAEIAIKKILNGRDIKSTDNFTFTATYQPDSTLAENERLRLNEGLDAKTKDLALSAMTPGRSTVDAAHPQGVGGEVNASTGTVTFTFDKTGTYKFKVTESGSNAGVTNDAKATTGEEVIVVIVKDTDGKLKVASTTYADGTDADFKNTYNAKGDATVQVRKIVSGAEWDENMAFWFDLQPKTAPAGYTTATMPKPAVRYEAAYNKTGRTATWNLSEFKLADAGKEFIYSVREQEPTFTGYVANEWVNDKSEHTIKIVPKDKGDGTLSFDIYYDSDTRPEFQPMAITNRKKGTSINVFASKEVVDRNGDPYWPDGLGGFELVFTAVTPGAPMPSGAEGGVKKLTAENATRQNFGLIDFDAAYAALAPGESKTFTYTFTETVDATKDYIDWGIDNTDTYTVEVTIAKDAGGNIIDPVRVRKNSAGEVVSSDGYPVIKNEYTAKGEIDLEATKVLQGRVLENQQFSFTLYDNEGNPLYRDAEGYITKDADDGQGHANTPITGTNDADGKVALGTFKYTDADAAAAPITYVLREDLPTGVTPANPTKDGYTYDTAAHPIVITMTDNGEGTLDVSADTANTKESGKKRLTVTNKYEAKGTQTFKVYKYLEERPIRRVGFTFNLKATGDDADVTPMPGGAKGDEATTQVLPSATYAHDGTAAFGDIVYTMDDLKKMVDHDSNPETPDVWDGTYETKTFTYEIKEVVPEGVDPDGATDGLTYAKTIYTASVEVKDNGDGTLKVTPTYTKKSGEGSKYGDNANNAPDATPGNNGTLDFTNIYDSDGSAELNLIKTILGRAWQDADEFTLVVEPLEGASYVGGGTHKTDVDDDMVPLPGNTIDQEHRELPGNTGTKAEVVVKGTDTVLGASSRIKTSDKIYYTDDMLTYDSGDGYLKGVFIYKVTEDTTNLPDGFTQTDDSTKTYYARVDVLDDRMGKLETTVSYYDKENDAKNGRNPIGTAPVFSNTYDAEGEANIPVKKFVDQGSTKDDNGWTLLEDSDEFSFTAAPVGEGPEVTPTTLKISKTTPDHKGVFKVAPIELSMLTYVTSDKNKDASGNAIKYSDGSDVLKDVKYMTFIGHVVENDLPASIKGVDKDDTDVFVKLIAIDKLNGTIDTQWKFYSDPACTQELEFDRTTATNDIEFTNIYRDVMDVEIQKTWLDGEAEDRPSIKIQLTRQTEGGNIETLMSLDGNAKLYAADDTTEINYANGEATVTAAQLPVTFKNLPATDRSGKPYTYSIVETDPGAGYFESKDPEVKQEGQIDDPETEEVEPSKPRILMLTNTKTTKLTVTKLWKDEDDFKHRGTVIVAALYKNGLLLPNNIQLVQNDSDPEWTTTFDNLPMYDENGLINYTAKEMAVPEEYYTSLVEYSLDNGTAANWQTDQSKLNGGVEAWNKDDHKFVQITNVLLTKLDVEKKWDGIPTDNVTYELYRTTDAEIVADPTKGIVKDPDTGLRSWTPDNKWEKVTESDGTTPRTHTFTTDEFYYAEGDDIPAGKKAGDLRDEPVKYTFTDLERYDKNGKEYVYRVYEITTGKYFEMNQDSNVKITNINKYTGQGKAKPNVVKELTGRRWNDKDKFYFMIEPIKGINDDGTPIDFTDSDEDQAAKAKVPLPKDADGDGKPDVIAETNKSKKRVGEIGRSVDFEDITFVSGDDDTANVKEGGFADYFYKIYEVDKDGNPIGGKTIDGITYTKDVHTLRINLSDDGLGGEKSITTQRYWDGSDTSSAVPVYVNRYKAYGISYGYVIKRIAGREFEEGDEFTFEFTNLSGSPVRREGPDATGTTDPVTGTVDPVGFADDEGVYVSGSAGKYDATGEKHGSDKAQEVGVNYINSGDLVAGADGILRGTFVYEFRELGGRAGDTVSKVPDLEYDDNLIYLQVKVTDNEDGTLMVEHKYYLDAACTKPLAGREHMEPMLLVDLETGDIAPAGAQSGTHVVTEEESTNQNSPYYGKAPGTKITYGYVASGYFRNRLKIDIPIAKKWVDEEGNITDPVDNVTVKLLKYPIFVDDQGNYWKDAAHTTPATLPDDEADWEFVSSHVFEVGDFYYKDGDDIPAGKDAGDLKDGPVDYTFEGVDLYEHNDEDGVPTGQQYIYRVLEANSSSSYKTTYRMGSSDDVKEWTETDTQGQDDKKPVVVNKITATNKANIATVKQLVGRDWLNTDYAEDNVDRYKFILTPVGRGQYGANGQLVKKDGKVQMDKDVGTNIPMPDSVISSELDPVDEKNKAMAANWTEYASGEVHTQEIVGEGERLARFGSIEYKLDDLVYNSKDGHMQGDFFYTLREEIPSEAKNAAGQTYGTEGAEGPWTYQGVTYDENEHTVHVRVRENRTNELIVQVGYDEKTEGDASTGTQFAPVFTNHYAATGDKAVSIDKKIMGRKWKEGDKLDFTMQALAGAPFNDAHPYDGPNPEFADPTADRRTSLDSGLAIHNDEGTKHVKRLIITTDDAGTTETQSLVMPGLAYKLSDLGKTTTVSGQYKYSGEGGRAVPAGTKYDEFMYAIEEEELYPADYPKDLELDKEPEYAKIIVIDKGNGELDFQIKIYEDRFGRNQRATDGKKYEPGTAQVPASHATFVNQAKRDIKVTKTWKGDLAEDVKIILQRRIPPEDPDDEDSGWEDYDTWTLSSKASPTPPQLKEETVNGVRLKVAEYVHTFKSIPVYGDDGNDINANDSQLQWRIVEEQTATEGMKTYYGVARPDDSDAAVTEEDAPDTTGYSTTADVAKDKTIDNVKTFVNDLDGNLYVTNVNAPEINPATAKVSGVKDIKGRDWTKDDEFTFKLTAVGIGTYTDGKLNVNEDGKVDREKLKEDDEGHVITDIPMPDPTTAIAKKDDTHPDYELSDSQWQTYFGDITIEAADVDFVKVGGKDVLMGDFFYDMTEVIPDAALAFDKATGEQIVIEGEPLTYEGAKPDQKADPNINWKHKNMTYDTRSHEVHVHVERTGNHLVATVSYDGKDIGGAVPVFTNRYKTTDSVEVHVMKKWVDKNNQEGKRPADGVKVKVVSTGTAEWDGKNVDGTLVEPITLNDANNRKDVFKELPKTNDAGVEYEYGVVELDTDGKTKLNNGSKTSYGYDVSITGDQEDGFVITNSYTPEELSVVVSKVWNDPADMTAEEKAELHSNVTMHLYGFKDEQVIYYAGSKKIEMDAQGVPTGSATFNKLPKRYFNKDDLEWKVVEDPVYGYTAKVEYQSESTQQWTETVPEDWNRQARVVNTYAKPVTTVTAVKKWEDSDNNDGKRPESVTFQLWRKVGDEHPEHVEGKDKVVTESTTEAGKPWSAKWTNLPTTTEVDTKDGQGEPVVQDKTRVEYQDVYQDKTGGQSIKKDVYDQLSPKGQDTYVEDGQGGYVNKDDPSDKIDQARYEALTPKGQNDYELEQNVPKQETEEETVKKEVPVLYVVKEVYEGGDDAHNLKKLGYEKPMVHATDKPGEFEIVNVHVPETTDVHVVKVWADQDDHDGIRPDHIGLKLMDDKTEVRKVSITEEDKWLLDGDKPAWSHTFKGVPVYDKGRKIDYSVIESGVPEGYTSETEDTTPEGAEYKQFTITNTHADDSLMKLTVNKVWASDDEDKSHRDDVKLRLIKVIEGARKDMGDEYAKELKYDPDDPDKPMTGTWENLPTSEKGKIVAYTVEEEPVAGYAVTYSDVTRKEAAPQEGDNPKQKGWFEKDGDKYVPTKDETVDPNKTYYTDECEVTVTNTFNSGGGELSGDVLYVDPKNEAGKMIVKSDRYGTKNQAESAAEKQKDKPADPSHAGYNFLGWALNKDENDNWVLVATYSEVAPTVKKITTYIDPQSGKVMLVSGESGTIKKPANPKHDGMIFVKWVKTKDAAGNTIYVAKFKCAAKGSSTSAPPKTYTQREQNLQRVTVVDTGDEAQLQLMVLFLTVSGAFAAAVIIRRRREDARRDNAA